MTIKDHNTPVFFDNLDSGRGTDNDTDITKCLGSGGM
jgi:hypothetical protein